MERARADGASVVTGGRISDRSAGHHHEPTLITGVRADHDIMRSEIFGPVLPVQMVEDLDEAIALANDSDDGLTSSIFTDDLNAALRACLTTGAGLRWVATCRMTGGVQRRYFRIGERHDASGGRRNPTHGAAGSPASPRRRNGHLGRARDGWAEPFSALGASTRSTVAWATLFARLLPIIRKGLRRRPTPVVKQALKASRELKFGETYVNREHFEAMQGFHAGRRKSGIGGADGKHGLYEFTETHMVYIQGR